MDNSFSPTAKAALLLALFTVLGTGVLSATHFATRDIIAAGEKQAKLALIGQILPAALYDNELLAAVRELPPTAELGNRDATPLYLARRGGTASAAVFECVAPDGYAGRIKLLVAVKANGELAGVRVVDHHETPGLGDYIEIARDAWITQFTGRSLENPAPGEWKVKKDGGQFTQRSGATVTPRAIVKAVRRALEYVASHRAQFFPEGEAK